MKILKWTLLISLISTSIAKAGAESSPNIVETPNEGIQPKVSVDASGQVHLLYYVGDPAGGDLYYIRKGHDGEFSEATRVNSIPGSAMSMGTIRGAQFTVGKEGSVHVVWNGSTESEEAESPHLVMYYTRSTSQGDGFEPQRVVSGEWSVDGGGAIASDSQGGIYVFWHSAPTGAEEKDRNVFLRISRDNGHQFDEEKIISPEGKGVCACCAMQADSDDDGRVYLAYRTATDDGKSRDINLLISDDGGKAFQSKLLERWKVASCPMSSMSFCETPEAMLVGWETKNRIRFTAVSKESLSNGGIISPATMSEKGKHPVFARSSNGNVLVAWTEGTGWKKGGTVAWQEYDASLKLVSETGKIPAGVSIWSFVAAYFDPTAQTFSLLH